jgi:hypothetical protein
MAEKQNPQGLKIEIAENEAEGVYSNLVIVSHSDSEFILDFARLLPGQPKAKVHSRVIMNPSNCKRFLAALTDNISRFEQQFGRIPEPALPVMPDGPGSVQ